MCLMSIGLGEILVMCLCFVLNGCVLMILFGLCRLLWCIVRLVVI